MNIRILQLSRGNEMGFLFESWDRIEDDFDFDNYVEVWNGTFESLGVTVPSTNNIWNLDKIFDIFNVNHPKDFHGHSLSVSDIVKLDNEYFYCDNFGWENITDKIN
jgi:hypothetical protein